MTEMHVSKGRLREAEGIARRVPEVLRRRGLQPTFSDWLLTEANGLTWLFGVLDVGRIARLEQYTSDDLVHHISTALGGRAVYISNTSGLRYAVLLSAPPRLPRQATFPGVRRGHALLGVRHTGATLSVPWERLGHLLVAGKTGSGKSSFLRLLGYQALSEGHALLLADRDNATFPMLAGHPSLLSPIAHTPPEVIALVERALGECDHRSALYSQVAGFPEKLEEYNAIVIQDGEPPLPRLLVVLDEFNATVLESGGAKGALAKSAAELGWRGRKFGIHLIFAAQDFTKAVVGQVRDQVAATVCFRVNNAAVARNVSCPDAARIPEQRPGLAVTDRWGALQAFYLDKRLLIEVGQGKLADSFTASERALVSRALDETEGRMSIPVLIAWGMSAKRARNLLKAWELRGWVAKDAQRQNARYLTPKLRDLWANGQAGQTGANALRSRQTEFGGGIKPKNPGIGLARHYSHVL